MSTLTPCPPASTPADDALVAALRERDESAYLELVRRYTPLMLRVARTVVGQREAAEDVVQDTWMAVLRSVDGFQGRSTFKTWLMRILVNTARSRRLREARTVSWPCQAGDAPVWDAVVAGRGGAVDAPLDHALAEEAWSAIRVAFAALPERQRVVVLLRDVEGSTSDEVRELLGLSVGNQRVLLHRGRARMRELLGAPDGARGRCVAVGA